MGVYLRMLSINEALTRTDGGGTTVYLADILGSTVALATGSGTLVTTYTHEPFGRTEDAGSPSPNAFQYTGRENDGTGLYYYRARYYDPGRARFVSEDPIGLRAGVNHYAHVDSVGETPTNLCSYAFNNPLTFVDPLGLWGFSIGFEGTGAALGFGAFGGFYGNYAHDPSQPWYRGWSSSVTITLGGGAAASAWGATGAVHLSGNNACDVRQWRAGSSTLAAYAWVLSLSKAM
jgi:RHS repeat-associated protein